MSDQPLPLTYFETPMRQEAPPVWPLPLLGVHNAVLQNVGKHTEQYVLGYAPRVVQPRLIPVLAVGNGDIARATDDHVVIHHHNGFETHYGQLAHVIMKPRSVRARAPKQWVRAGDPIGFICAGQSLTFEIWRRDPDRPYMPVSIAKHVGHWGDVDWTWPVAPDLSKLFEAANDNEPAMAA